MTLIKTSLLNAIAVSIKMLTLLGINKVLAMYVGPAGYAAVGQFQNGVQIITAFASGAINTGVTKYTAEYNEDALKQVRLWQTAGTIALILSLAAAGVILFFSDLLAIWFLNDESYRNVFNWFAATLLFFVLNALLLAILNGKKDVGRFVVANIAGSIFSLVVTTILAVLYGLEGALISLAIYQSIAFFITLAICMRAPWFELHYLFGSIDRGLLKLLGKYAAMALTTAACVPVSHLIIRTYLGENLGWEAAGYWEAMWRLSSAYLMLVTTTLSVYYLPRLSEIKDITEIRIEVIQGYKIILPVAAACGLAMYLLRDPIIAVLFTSEFLPMRELFGPQLVGDTLKIGSWILAYIMLGRALIKLYIFSEIIFSISFVVFTVLLVDTFGLEGVAYAHLINYALYWVTMAYFVKRGLKGPATT